MEVPTNDWVDDLMVEFYEIVAGVQHTATSIRHEQRRPQIAPKCDGKAMEGMLWGAHLEQVKVQQIPSESQ